MPNKNSYIQTDAINEILFQMHYDITKYSLGGRAFITTLSFNGGTLVLITILGIGVLSLVRFHYLFSYPFK